MAQQTQQLLAPVEGTPYINPQQVGGMIYVDTNGLQRTDGPTIDSSGNMTVGGDLNVGIINATAPSITDTPLVINAAAGQTAPVVVYNDGTDDILTVAANGDTDLCRVGDTIGVSVQLSHWSSKTSRRSSFDFRRSGSNTHGGDAVLSDGVQMGDVFWHGNDGAGFHETARIYCVSAGTSNNNTPGKIRFATTPVGTYLTTDRMEIDETGLVTMYDDLKVDGAATVAGDLTLSSPTVPATAASTGVTGTVAWDSGHVYVCVATDTWKRTAIATW
jgi:hypothetical protein